MCILFWQVCKRWRGVARLAWSTRQCIRINHRNITSSHDHVLTTIITRKHIGHALTHFELDGYMLESRKELSLAALAQHCPNLKHLHLRQVYFHTCEQRQSNLNWLNVFFVVFCFYAT